MKSTESKAQDPKQSHGNPNASIWQRLLERETRHLAHELHNQLAQELAALRFDISLFLLQSKTDMDFQERGQQMLNLANRCFQTNNRLVNCLHPPSFELGLAEILHSLAAEFCQTYPIACNLQLQATYPQVSSEKISLLYRILTEVLSNVAKHAHAKQVNINLSNWTDQALQLVISDDGCGFDSLQSVTDQQLGLALIHECAITIGAVVDIKTQINQGTQVSIVLPVGSDGC
jgi:signal transduction histidine kinase